MDYSPKSTGKTTLIEYDVQNGFLDITDIDTYTKKISLMWAKKSYFTTHYLLK